MDPKNDYQKAAIGVTTVTPSETAIIMANVPLADRWLENAGVSRIFHVNSLKGVGVQEILDYLLAEN